MSRFSVLYDANILYPATLRDSFLRLALSGLFQAYWTTDINDEWITALLRNHGDKFTREQLELVRGLMNRHVPHAIITGYTHLIDGLHLPDRDDRHVLAAAIKQGVDAIVTFNLKDFPASEVSKYDIEVIHPDDFIFAQLELSTPKVCALFREQRQSLKNPPYSSEEFVQNLQRQKLPQTCAKLREYIELI